MVKTRGKSQSVENQNDNENKHVDKLKNIDKKVFFIHNKILKIDNDENNSDENIVDGNENNLLERSTTTATTTTTTTTTNKDEVVDNAHIINVHNGPDSSTIDDEKKITAINNGNESNGQQNNNDDLNNINIIRLRNPATGKTSRFILLKESKLLYEIYQFAEPNRSWFIAETISSNGNIYLTTQIDPLFLILYYLKLNCSEFAKPLDQVLIDDEFPHTNLLNDIITNDQLSLIGDQKGGRKSNAYRYNENKTLIWLELKSKNLIKQLHIQSCNVESNTAISSSFVKSQKLLQDKINEEQNANEYLLYSVGILSEYITKELSVALSLHLGLRTENNKKRKSLHDIENPTLKRVKSMNYIEVSDVTNLLNPDNNSFINDNTNDYNGGNSNSTVNNVSKEKKVSAKQKALAKAASGSKAISSFFKRK